MIFRYSRSEKILNIFRGERGGGVVSEGTPSIDKREVRGKGERGSCLKDGDVPSGNKFVDNRFRVVNIELIFTLAMSTPIRVAKRDRNEREGREAVAFYEGGSKGERGGDEESCREVEGRIITKRGSKFFESLIKIIYMVESTRQTIKGERKGGEVVKAKGKIPLTKRVR